MSRAQRFTFLVIALVIAVVAVVLIAGSGDDSNDEDVRTSETTTPTPTQEPTEAAPQETETPTPTPTPTPEPPPLLTSGKVTRMDFKKDETVRFRVRSDVDEEIHVHGYDIEEEIPAGKTVTVSFKGTIEGIFEIEFHGSGEQIGELRVEPK
jgi:hypothetical protein